MSAFGVWELNKYGRGHDRIIYDCVDAFHLFYCECVCVCLLYYVLARAPVIQSIKKLWVRLRLRQPNSCCIFLSVMYTYASLEYVC